jgi:SAM-dependent methyltransferase
MSIDTPEAPGANADQINFWNAEAGETWAALQARLDGQLGSLGALAMDALAPAAGERLIDVGCGCGQTTVTLAERVGPTGSVLGVDVSGPMLAVARSRAGDAAGVGFLEADAQTHAFEPDGADAVFSRFGVMFFADPIAAFANLRAAVAPGGRLAFVCWRAMELNLFMTVPLMAALSHLATAPAPPDPTAPGPFAFADKERVTDILARAGWSQIRMEPHDEAIGGGTLEETVETALRIGPLGRALREQPESAQAARNAVREALAPYLGKHGVALPSASWIVTATNDVGRGSR